MQKQTWFNRTQKKPQITIVIPTRSNAKITYDSLQKQSFKDYKLVVVKDNGNGANWARNKGFEQCDTEFVLFSDDDIEWEYDGIQTMLDAFEDGVSYVYGSYEMDRTEYCNKEFNADDLIDANYISTMSIIRSKDFPGFDESLKRFQDWDLWLTMLSQGKIGKYCGKRIFKTKPSKITKGDPTEAFLIVKNKWKSLQTT